MDILKVNHMPENEVTCNFSEIDCVHWQHHRRTQDHGSGGQKQLEACDSRVSVVFYFNNNSSKLCRLGGKSPNIIFNDADLDNAVEWTAFGI
jgi:hypothetical protein